MTETTTTLEDAIYELVNKAEIWRVAHYYMKVAQEDLARLALDEYDEFIGDLTQVPTDLLRNFLHLDAKDRAIPMDVLVDELMKRRKEAA